MNTPQIVMLAIHLIALLLAANKHNKPKEGKENFWIYLLSTVIANVILIWGGWFK